MEIQDEPLSDDFMINISERLEQAIKRTNVTQAEIAKRAKLTPQRLNNYINRGTLPDLDTAARLAVVTNVSLDWLVGLSASGPIEIAPIVTRLLELDGMESSHAGLIASVVQQALNIVQEMSDEGDVLLRSRLAAQAAWIASRDLRPN